MLFQDPLSDAVCDPLPVTCGSYFLRLCRVCHVGALAEDTGNLRIASESQAPSNHPLIRLVRCRNQLLLNPRRQTVTVRSPEKGLRSVHRTIGYRIVVNADEHGARTLSVRNTNTII